MQLICKRTVRAEVTALHEDELVEVFARLGVASQYHNNEMVCAICSGSVRPLGIGAISFANDEVIVACGRLDCLEYFHG